MTGIYHVFVCSLPSWNRHETKMACCLLSASTEIVSERNLWFMSVFLICLIYMRLDFQSIFLAKQPLAHVQWNLYSVQFR